MIRTRFAPSPTGSLHIGGIRTALYAWAWARKNNGAFVLRIEDTDTDRSTKESEKTILDGLHWLGIDWDEGPIRQSDRLERYQEVANKLIDLGLAYRCTDVNPQTKNVAFRGSNRDQNEKLSKDNFVVRMKVPDDKTITFSDTVKGDLSFKTNGIEDWVLVRSNGVPTYNFAVVVDDIDMNISHVIRGDDHLNNTPKQVLLYNMLDAKVPVFTHVPLILSPSGKKISKRDVPDHNSIPTTLDGMIGEGILPDALLNYMARLGWAHGDDEIFSTDQFLNWFDLKDINTAPAKVDAKKLNWVNAQYLKALSSKAFEDWCISQPNVVDSYTFRQRLPVVKGLLNSRCNETATFRQDIVELSKIASSGIRPISLEPQAKATISSLSSEWDRISQSPENIDACLKEVATSHGIAFKDLAVAIRTSFTSALKTPPIGTMMLIKNPEELKQWMSSLEPPSETLTPAG